MADPSFSFQEQAPNAIKKLEKCFSDDKSIPEIFSQLASLSSKEPKNYYSATNTSDIFTVSSLKPFPNPLDLHYASSTNHFYIGHFPEIDRFYALVDTKIFIWEPIGSCMTDAFQDNEVILSACIIKANHKLFEPNVTHFLAISSCTLIKLFPYIDQKFDFTRFYSKETSFTPFSMSAGYGHELLIGSQNGDIYKLNFVESSGLSFTSIFSNNDNPLRIEVELSNATSGIIDALIPNFLKFSKHSISKIVYEPSSHHVASLNDDSCISFYSTSEDSFTYLSSFSAPSSVVFIGISPVPVSDSSYIRFVAFDTMGNRYFFGHGKSIFGMKSTITLQAKRPPPKELKGLKIFAASYNLGYSTFSCDDGLLVVIRSVSVKDGETYEILSTQKTYGSGFVISIPQKNHVLTTNYSVFKDPQMWQHIFEGQIGYLINSSGICSINYSLPFCTLKRCIFESKGEIDKSIGQVFYQTASNNECILSSLLIRSLYPEIKTPVNQIATIYSNLIKGNDNPPIIESYYQIVARMICLVWNSIIFIPSIKNPNYYNVNPAIDLLPKDYIVRLNSIISQIQEVLSSNYFNEISFLEISNLAELKVILDYVIEIVRFFQIIGTQSSILITQALEGLNNSEQDILKSYSIGDFKEKDNYLNSLMEFSRNLIRILSKTKESAYFSSQLSNECPRILRINESLIIEAENSLSLAFSLPSDSRRQIVLKSVNTFMSSSQYEFDIQKVCNSLTILGYPAQAVQIAISKSKTLDPHQNALKWFRSGCDTSDIQGTTAFNRVYSIYEAAFAAILTEQGYSEALNSNDELFHYSIYQKLLDSHEVQKLISIKSPYIQGFLKENARAYLWQQLEKCNKKHEAVQELMSLASDSLNVSFEERIAWLSKALEIISTDEQLALHKEIKVRLQCAIIQRDIFNETGKIESPLLPLETLLQESMSSKLYHYSLSIIGIKAYPNEDLRKQKLSKIWEQLLCSISSLSPKEMSEKVCATISKLPIDSPALSLRNLIPIFEDARVQFNLSPIWVPETLTLCGISGSMIFRVYNEMLNELELPKHLKYDNIYSMLWLLSFRYKGNYLSIRNIVTECIADQSYKYRNEVVSLDNQIQQIE